MVGARGAYDPDQDPEEKRAVRRNYRDLHKDTEGDYEGANHNDLTAEELAEKVHRADTLFSQVRAPQEATLDSHFLVLASNMGAQKARAMRAGGGAFDAEDFVSKLITFMGGRRLGEDQLPGEDDEDGYGDAPLDWDKIGRKALAKSRRVPAMDFMLGPLAIEVKKRNVAKRAKLEKNKDEERRPQEIHEEDITRSENETTKNVLILEKLLSAQDEPINLFRFVINPGDYGQSVENLFYLSFLIRDGKCALDTESGEPTIWLCETPTEDDYSQGLKKRQIVFEFDMATWRRAIEVFNITETIIPTRPPAETRIGKNWYG
ncbi:hypothetical protein GLOTRDRAFT_38990 [Gloeophyllum trabeum ATCC 11539]|uniref:Non-structural maintenance of chromosomes element 4 n=1 Tax=Gloeophyllum trabeum (strain ATCC 11539 / FP-39264 / Madison 617) TaxID=670483 RepID=S7QBL3_GLOTA|nr:uncharacterized protein GLOTRDRAFT_38990 [Gloeophyllum trabeum ATCC 11539]EPQ57351.1 hypothetical protein GLOTRDRAFT_38990 [Gloeophyllum trabeum ATCC 11539]